MPPAANTDTLAAPVGPAEIIRPGKDEMNLAEFPITLLADRVPPGQTSIQYQDKIYDEKLGKTITRKLTISAPLDESGKSGLPTAVDDDVILGLIQLTKLANGFTSREVEFSRLELIKLLGWPDSGESYKRLTKSLKRWLSVTLLYENAWRDNRRGKWTTKGFHILDNIELNDTRHNTAQGELFPSKIYWNQEVFASFESGYLKGLDYGLYLTLKNQTSKRMYRFLSKRMYFGPQLTLDLKDFGIAHIGLSDSYASNAGKLKEKLQPALRELESVGFLEPASKDERYQKEGKNWKIRLASRVKPPAPPAAAPGLPDLSGLATTLVQRGVSQETAANLVQRFPERIEPQVEAFDWKMAHDKPKRPVGYLVKSIEQNYALPDGFTSRAEVQRKQEARQARERQETEERRRQRDKEARDKAQRKAIDAYWEALTPEQQAELQAQADALADPADLAGETGTFKRMGQQIRRGEYIRRLLQHQEPSPTEA